MRYLLDGFYLNGDKYHDSCECIISLNVLLDEISDLYINSLNSGSDQPLEDHINIDTLVVSTEKE